MDLLILVTAITAIIAFFMFGLADITKVNEAGELASRLKETSFAFVSSPNYCFSDSYFLPNDFQVAGNTFYYVMKISEQKLETEDNEILNVVIFSVYPRTEIRRFFDDSSYEPKAIAADSFRTKAEIFLWSRDYKDLGNGIGYEGALQERTNLDEGVFLDPQAVTPVNSLELVKEVKNGQPFLYIIACNAALCDADKTVVGEQVHPPDASTGSEGGFSC